MLTEQGHAPALIVFDKLMNQYCMRAGLSLEAAGQAMGADSQMSPYSRDMAGSSLHFPQAQAHFFSTATSARQQPYEQTAQVMPKAQPSRAFSLDLDLLPNPQEG